MFADFYEETVEAVLGFFLRETENEQIALDLWAETFATAFEKREDFKGAEDKQAAKWLWTIAHRKLARFYERQSVERETLKRVGWARPYATEDELREIELIGVDEDIRDHLDAAVGRLPADQREVIRLRFDHDLTYPEIGERLGVSTEVARTRGFRWLRALRSSHHAREIRVLRQT
jgi:RNA polymerase sigma-70 factor (ECF subfamily)